jgi:pseudaminic acid cytidylyltransferase
MKIAVIPARAGSKRIPKKNIKIFMGKPIIAWSIEAALRSELFDQVVVSTDSLEIAAIAREYGASIPFLRPDNISDDFSTTTDVMAHVANFFANINPAINFLCCIYPAAPFIDVEDLKKGSEIISNGTWDYVFSASEYSSAVHRSFIKNDDNQVKMLFPENLNVRSQDLANVYYDAAQFYWGRLTAWLEAKKIFDIKSTIVEIPSQRAKDIDTMDDWIKAERSAA